MNDYIILPLRKLLETDRPYVKLGDLQQVVDKVKKQRAQKFANPDQKHAVSLEDNYLKVLADVMEGLTKEQKITQEELRTRIDRALRKLNFIYTPRRHRPAHNNSFYARHERDKIYDVAFYNAAAPENELAHHRHKEENSIFYARFEERGEEVLVGNMQIDPRKYSGWRDEALPKTLLQTKNIYRALVQEAVKQALKTGKRRILFQGGVAMEHAQGLPARRRVKKITITRENHQKYKRLYEEWQEKFAAATVGSAAIHFNHWWENYGIITEKTPDYYKCAYSNNGPAGTALLEELGGIYGQMEQPYHDDNKRKRLYELEVQARKHYLAKDFAALVEEIDAAFKLFAPEYAPGAPEKKLAYFQTAWAQPAAPRKGMGFTTAFAGLLDRFLIAFDYHQVMLAALPMLRAVKLAPELAAHTKKSAWRFYNPAAGKRIMETFYRQEILAPKLGKEYLVPTEALDLPLSNYHMKDKNNYRWYEKDLPEILQQLGLTIKKVPLAPGADGNTSAEAWELVDGLEDFAARPLVSFAHGAVLKSDTEVLPRLQAAAQKFGLSPEKLHILNDWLGRPEGNFLGEYNAANDKVTLSTGSLSLLAHEGLHRLLKKGLVPAREYQALVAAGKSLVKKSPRWASRIKHVTRTRARNDEYAALFVEKYYENNAQARRELMNKRVPVFKKIMGYLGEARDVLAARCGHRPALARNFLRRI